MAISNVFNLNGGTGSTSGSVEFPFINSMEVTVTHSFSTKPTVFIVDLEGNVVVGDVQFINSTQIVVKFAVNFSGRIILR